MIFFIDSWFNSIRSYTPFLYFPKFSELCIANPDPKYSVLICYPNSEHISQNIYLFVNQSYSDKKHAILVSRYIVTVRHDINVSID